MGTIEKAKNKLEIFLTEIGLEPVVLHRPLMKVKQSSRNSNSRSDVGYAFRDSYAR